MAGKISLGLSVLLAIAVAYLFFNKPAEPEVIEESALTEEVQSSDGPKTMAYIDEDSLIAGYDFVIEKKPLVDAKLNRGQKKLEEDMMYYQDQVGKFQQGQANFSEQEIQIQMRTFQKLEQDLQRKERDLQELELKFLQEVEERVMAYIDDYCEENNIDLMFAHRAGLTTMYYRGGIQNATADVLAGLNEEYALELEDVVE